MLELNISVRVHDKARRNIIGLKDDIASRLESVADVLFIDVTDADPLQLSLDNPPKIRQTITVSKAREELIKNKLSIEEYKNIIQAIVDITQIEGVENNE
jgi:hypothetical protein